MRICVYPADVQVLTGRSENYSRALIRKIKRHLGKEKYQLVTIEEFAAYSGISLELIRTVVK